MMSGGNMKNLTKPIISICTYEVMMIIVFIYCSITTRTIVYRNILSENY